jgi:ribosomal protection tetracycline resistance protein
MAARLTEQIAEYDDAVLARYVHGGHPLPQAEARGRLASLTASGRMHPTYFGAALHGVGVREVMAGIATYLSPSEPTLDPGLHAQVFKVDGGHGRPKTAFLRVRSGTLAARDAVTYHRRSPLGQVIVGSGRASAVRVLDSARLTVERPARAGDIATVMGLPDLRIGDQIGHWDASLGGRHFALPGLEAVVEPVRPEQRGELFAALRHLCEQDPLIDARLDGLDEEMTVSLYGEVQKEVLAARLAEEYGVEARFLTSRTVHVERVNGIGEAVEVIDSQNATVGLRVEPGPIDSGFEYRLEVERGWLLPSYHTAVEETLALELAEGIMGWRVIDCRVALIASRFSAPTPPAGYFRRLTSLAFRRALRQAGTTVCEPYSEFEVEFPAAVVNQLMRELAVAGATPTGSTLGLERGRITGTMPTAAVHGLEQRLPHLTQGLGVLLSQPGGYRPVTGPVPSRRFSDGSAVR